MTETEIQKHMTYPNLAKFNVVSEPWRPESKTYQHPLFEQGNEVPVSFETRDTPEITRTFNGKLCCLHKWNLLKVDSEHEEKFYTCVECGAECTKNKRNKIVEYVRNPASEIR